MTMKKKSKLTMVIVLAIVVVLIIAMTPILINALNKGNDGDGASSGGGSDSERILEGEVVFDENSDLVKVAKGYVYSTDEVLLIEVNVNNYGVIKLAFEKSESTDARGAYRYDIVAEECETLAVDYTGSVTVTADLLVTTTNTRSYKVYSYTYTTANTWTKAY